ncbi:hypothetical protein BayCH28_12890 [Mycolicibacterium sp. CH28]|uniref:hypothetical protein n=1 Tax=Mycolicibacterium sp. CH28 TaxID=2512237 RepID=UPI00108093C5|nr:hypothetical protein [Mycolicibacterium sp. CH28]TGD87287.1 hypothetical protein BayCH28_12890 [Mycolicibacterium sp. CH28]
MRTVRESGDQPTSLRVEKLVAGQGISRLERGIRVESVALGGPDGSPLARADRLVLGGGALSDAGGSLVRRDLAEKIDGSVEDTCATLRFPSPAVVVAPSRAAMTPA